MEQISMFEEGLSFPQSYDDIKALFEKYIYEGEKDSDVFDGKPKKDGGISCFFYGKKVFEFYPAGVKQSYLKIMDTTIVDGEEKTTFRKITAADGTDTLESELNKLKERKHIIFRNTITDTFACCNDYKKCSAVDKCIHPDDRFYNGCYYRTNLEAGRNFYKEENSQ